MDYLFMGSAHTKVSQYTKAATILGVKEKDRRMHMSTAVPKKGGSVDFVAKRVMAFLDELGLSHCPVTFKTDQEPSIIDLVNKLKSLRVGIITHIENSQVGASASNGVMERGCQALEGMIRVLKDALETRWDRKIDSNHHIVSWIIEYAAVLLNRYEVGHDGKIGHERSRGKPSRMLGIEFGEKLMFRRIPIGRRLAKMESLWEVGIYVGYKSQSGENHGRQQGWDIPYSYDQTSSFRRSLEGRPHQLCAHDPMEHKDWGRRRHRPHAGNPGRDEGAGCGGHEADR